MNVPELAGKTLAEELNWFQRVLDVRLGNYFEGKGKIENPLVMKPPEITERESYYARLVDHYRLVPEERLVLMLALAPDVKPGCLDIFFTRNATFDRGFTEFGGVLGKQHGGFIPTMETTYFLLCGIDLGLRFTYAHFFESLHPFQAFNILDLQYKDIHEPDNSTPLRLHRDVLDMMMLGYLREPETSVNFPARRLKTEWEWDDIVFSSQTEEQLKELRAWLAHETILLDEWHFRKTLKPGYKCLFYGPPGTGKTLTASLLGKLAQRHVYRVDLAQLVSKYIGETEKNLEKVFQQAEKRNWILFFDEADALFARRTQVSDAHDRYANQGSAYLLQRIEECPNVIILATNYRTNIDEAFARRFQSTVYFPIPSKAERLKLWQQGFSPVSTLETSIDLDEISDQYQMAGGSIMNVVRYASLMAIQKESRMISYDDLLIGIQREFGKEGRSI
jgi:ATPase family associated with various cellular activities (AAA)